MREMVITTCKKKLLSWEVLIKCPLLLSFIFLGDNLALCHYSQTTIVYNPAGGKCHLYRLLIIAARVVYS